MRRRIIHIDANACNGCGACAAACHEGAIEMINGKATLTREDYCDGLGDCLPACPVGAIHFEEREASPYNAEAVQAAKATRAKQAPACACRGTRAELFQHADAPASPRAAALPSQLMQWPCQIKLVPANAPYFDHANLLIAADCTAYAYGDFHRQFMRNHLTLIACPKLDNTDYTETLTRILATNTLKRVTVVRMEVPCCAGLENAVKRALSACGRSIPCRVVTISTDGHMIDATT